MVGPIGLLLPPLTLVTAVLTLPFTLLALPLSDASALFSWPKLRHRWFLHFWWWFGPATKPFFAPSVVPLLEQAHGKVLDIGPASGIWMSDLGKAAAATGKIEKIYGVEPNVLFHKQLKAGAKKAGLEDRYEPIAAYAQDLESRGIKKGSIDTIITVHVLCSVGSHAPGIVKELYEYLKPGGLWLVYEHVAARNVPVKSWQYLHNLVWPYVLDGCSITEDTGALLARAGAWESVEIGPDPREGPLDSLPHVMGTMVKKRA
ncbi:hypothetical protein BAUCODRAFT_36713 [Baudoinia panamericana UAMH 10762]|uniref:Methyltransferase type 11 domain-containing protein n=1 Tax=Baudoinia panamericana (strain UAMH 10762) TaxID=717646 RepID=M2N5C4_BAUPA|nr:uncharacterized protein BAUCODRAFT_36713 [Baudoinia panamericana UAMH 10762]EMC94244.1 hypothetical protein BAUCODRAFT_36713 [Baudoinia panamericana UAMH 10762]